MCAAIVCTGVLRSVPIQLKITLVILLISTTKLQLSDDRNMVESQLSYEKRLKDSEEIITRWRGETGV